MKKHLFFALLSCLWLLLAPPAGRALPPSEDEPWIPPPGEGDEFLPAPDAFGEAWKASRVRKSPEELMIERVSSLGTVVIDPGHGGYDPGLPGEKEKTLTVARALEAVVLRGGARAVLTRTSNRYLPLSARLEVVWRERPDLFISIHMAREGFAVYNVTHREALVRSLRMKNRLLQNLADFFGAENVIERRLPLFLLGQIRMPGVTVEIPASLEIEDEKTLSRLVQAIVFSIEPDERKVSSPYPER